MTLRESATLGLELMLVVRLLDGIGMVRISVNCRDAKYIAGMGWKIDL